MTDGTINHHPEITKYTFLVLNSILLQYIKSNTTLAILKFRLLFDHDLKVFKKISLYDNLGIQ